MINVKSSYTGQREFSIRSSVVLFFKWIVCICVLIGAPSISDAGNGKSPSVQRHARQLVTNEMLERILTDSGVLPQLSKLASTIIGESREHWRSCNTPVARLEHWINEAYIADEITRLAVNKLKDALDASTVVDVIVWLDSSSGQAIVNAERASASLSDEQFERYIGELGVLPTYRTARAPRIRSLLNSIRAAEFVSVLNTELNAAVSLSTSCKPGGDTVRQLLNAANAERMDLSLVTLVVGINLQAPTAVVYRELDDPVIDEYLKFAESIAGQAYHAALIKVTQDTLANRLEALGRWRMK